MIFDGDILKIARLGHGIRVLRSVRRRGGTRIPCSDFHHVKRPIA